MARSQTILSELAVGLGILGKKHNDFSALKLINHVMPEDIEIYKQEHASRVSNKKSSLIALEQSGYRINQWFKKEFGSAFNIKINWVGHTKIGTTEQAGKDLEIQNLNWRISVKEDSNILLNGSPERVFEGFPEGDFAKVKGENWFLRTAPAELESYFQLCQGMYPMKYKSCQSYFENTSAAERKSFGEYVAGLHQSNSQTILGAYSQLCEQVSHKSAEIFNKKFEESKNARNFKDTKAKIFHQFFRINGVKYILAGTYKGNAFAQVIIPSAEWEKEYKFIDIIAEPNPAGQPEVYFHFTFEQVATKNKYSYSIRAEIRWSHGKFCGNPESKLYQKWDPRTLPWVTPI